jgi:hypothetical protein
MWVRPASETETELAEAYSHFLHAAQEFYRLGQFSHHAFLSFGNDAVEQMNTFVLTSPPENGYAIEERR